MMQPSQSWGCKWTVRHSKTCKPRHVQVSGAASHQNYTSIHFRVLVAPIDSYNSCPGRTDKAGSVALLFLFISVVHVPSSDLHPLYLKDVV